MLLEIQHYGTLSAQVFFGLWLAPLGYLAYKSRLFPRSMGVVLVVGVTSPQTGTGPSVATVAPIAV
jgi:hypothetical protein